MKNLRKFLILVFLLSFQTLAIAESFRFGAFNIENFGRSKMHLPHLSGRSFDRKTLEKFELRKHVPKTLVKILSRYDLVLLQEIEDPDIPQDLTDEYQTATETLLQKLIDYDGGKWESVVSEKRGKGSSGEKYAYFYRSNLFRVKKEIPYTNTNGKTTFKRPPYIVHFETRGSKSFDFMVVGIHTDPKKAFSEVKQLERVHNYVKRKYKERDYIFAGDFNISCDYVKNQSYNDLQEALEEDPKNSQFSDYSQFSDDQLYQLFARAKYVDNPLSGNEYTWHINDYANTTVATTTFCAYDRIITTGELTERAIPGSARVYMFDKEYYPEEYKLYVKFFKDYLQRKVDITNKRAKKVLSRPRNISKAIEKIQDVSDHYPVEMEFKISSKGRTGGGASPPSARPRPGRDSKVISKILTFKNPRYKRGKKGEYIYLLKVKNIDSIKDLNVSLEVSHNNVRNLAIDILIPDGTKATLRRYRKPKTDESEEEVVEEYGMKADSSLDRRRVRSLSRLKGKGATGTWEIRIKDKSRKPTRAKLMFVALEIYQ